jgi:predicted deacylase
MKMELIAFDRLAPGRWHQVIMNFQAKVLQDLRMPALVANGGQSGPSVCVTAGMHGGEYAGIAAALKVPQLVDASTVAGRLVVVPVVNLPAFWQKKQYVCPVDGKNPSGVFPGRPDGTFTEVLAHELWNDLLEGMDILIDLHCGDITEDLIPFTIIQDTGDAAYNARSRDLARSFGHPYVVVRDKAVLDRKPIGYLQGVAAAVGKAAVVAEVGGRGIASMREVELHFSGLLGALRWAGTVPAGGPNTVDDIPHVRFAIQISPYDGLFTSRVATGQTVRQGDAIGTIRPLPGASDPEVNLRAEQDAVVLFQSTSLAAPKGDVLFGLGVPV